MNYIIFDSGPLISLTMSNVLWVLEPLQRRYQGTFAITEAVKHEIVDKPLKTKRFQLEALQILEKIEEGTLRIVSNKKIVSIGKELTDFANSLFEADGKRVHVVDLAEMQSLAAGVLLEADAVVVDERVTLSLVDDPHVVRAILERRLHKRVQMDDAQVHKFNQRVKGLRLIRSTELAMRAFDLGLLDHYIPQIVEKPRERTIDALLWKLKLSGAAITDREITAYKKLVQ